MGPFLPLGPLPVLPLSLDCPFLIGPSVFSDAYLSCVLCTQCYHCLWIVHSWLILQFSLRLICPVSCVPSATIVFGLSIPDWSFGFLWRLFVLCLVYPVLPLSLDCLFLISPSVFSNPYLSCILSTQCYHCLWIVHSWLVLRFSLTLICPVSFVPSATIVSGLYIPDCSFAFVWRLFIVCLVYPVLSLSQDCPFLIDPWVFSDAYLSWILCTQCYHCLWIVHSWLILGFSLTLICPVSCVPSATIVFGLSIPDWSFDFLWRLFVVCPVYPVLPLSLDCPFLIDPSVFSDAYLSCVLCTQCYHCLWIVHSWLVLGFSLTLICPVW
jgi:hypothetical protein